MNRIEITSLKDPGMLLATGLGSGLLPVAPGTSGTVLAVFVYLAISQLPLPAYLAATILITLAGTWLCGYAARRLGVHDHPGIVIDEVAGYLVTMIAAPGGWAPVIAGFVLFRFFDVLKPWPIRWLDRHVGGGTGIMLDDVVAGLFSLVVLQLLFTTLVRICEELPSYCAVY